MPLASNYANGTFYGGKWFCDCGWEAYWWTSKKDGSRGERFARCPNFPKEQCNFFLTEEDDARARAEKSSDIPPAPRTPTGRQNGGMPTPSTDTRTGSGLFGTGFPRRGYFQRPDESPTPNRFRADEDGDLPSLILGLLRKDGIVLKSSTESAIQFLIGDRIAGYEAKLQNSAENLNMVYKKLDELEKGASPVVTNN